jgi:hypothetical protein
MSWYGSGFLGGWEKGINRLDAEEKKFFLATDGTRNKHGFGNGGIDGWLI